MTIWPKKRGFFLVGCLQALLLLLPAVGTCAPVYEITDYITGIEGLTYRFDVGDVPGTFEVSLSDLSFGPLAFDYIGISISTATESLGSLESPGTFTFNGLPETIYYANIFGVGGGEFDTGLYGLQVDPVPLPASLVLLLSGILMMITIRRRRAA